MTNDNDDVIFVFDLVFVLLPFFNGDDIFELQYKANIIA
jgi:hypothetical protein